MQRTLNGRFKMHNLTTRMHHGIGSPCATDCHGNTASHCSKRLFQCPLNRRHTSSLTLKAAITRTFVLNTERYLENANGSRFGCRCSNTI
jgi:hypothetical protein